MEKHKNYENGKRNKKEYFLNVILMFARRRKNYNLQEEISTVFFVKKWRRLVVYEQKIYILNEIHFIRHV